MKNEIEFVLAPGVALGNNDTTWDQQISRRVEWLRRKFEKLLRPKRPGK